MTKTFYPILNILPYFTPMSQLKKKSQKNGYNAIMPLVCASPTVHQKRLPSIITVTCDSEPKNTQDGEISDITVLELGQTVNSHVQLSYLKGLTPS